MTTADASFEAVIADFRAGLESRVAGGSTRLDTHISAVILAGSHAWKFKKPVDFGFVDFTTLERRRHFCDREIELNRRFAPTLYEGVETVTADDDRTAVEYAVRMRRFEAAATLDRLVSAAAIEADEMAAFGRELAGIHASLAVAEPGSAYGQASLSGQQILAATAAPLDAELPPRFAAQLAATVERLRDELAARKSAGQVRDCHGDLHLTNIVRYEGRLVAFDCIEFNDELRIIDTLSDAAFLLMDLDHYGAGSLANAFFNHYIEASGDHAGLRLLPLYLAYRSLVRAKVALLGENRDGRGRAAAHVALAQRYLEPRGKPGLVITHGLSGSGKSFSARKLARERGFLHLRSDIERRRLAGMALDEDSASAVGGGIYSAAHGAATYTRLLELAREALAAGYSTVVDAAFLTRQQRSPFRALAEDLGVPFHVLACSAPRDTLAQRIEQRGADGDDPSEATIDVLDAQCETIEPLDAATEGAIVCLADLDDGERLAALGPARPGLS